MKVTGVLIDVSKNPGSVSIKDIEEEGLYEFYSALDCSTIDIVVRKIDGRAFNIVCDGEGLLKEQPIVTAVEKDGKYALVGNLFICNNYREHLTSLSKNDISHIMNNIVIAAQATRDGKSIQVHPLVTNVEYV